MVYLYLLSISIMKSSGTSASIGNQVVIRKILGIISMKSFGNRNASPYQSRIVSDSVTF